MNTLREVLSNVKKVTRNEFLGECWEWQLSTANGGYATVNFRGRMTVGHRLVASMLVGDVTAHECVRHLCDNKKCINPQHLMLGSKLENSRDWAERGWRRTRKLTESDIIEIRKAVASGQPLKAIASRMGISKSHVCGVANGSFAKHVSGSLTPRPRSGEKSYNAKLTADDVRRIRERFKNGDSISGMAREFKVTYVSVRLIVRGKTWEEVT